MKRLANNVVGSKVLGSVQEEDGKDEDMEIPDLVDNFENVANAAGPTAIEQQAEEIVAKIAKATIEEAAKPKQPAPASAKAPPPTAAPAAAPAAAADDKKKETKKESAPKKSPNDKNKKQQSKDKKA